LSIRRRILGLLLVAGLTASCGLTGASPFGLRNPVPSAMGPLPRTTIPPPANCDPKPVNIKFKFAPETTAADQALIRDALEKARTYYPLRFPRISRYSYAQERNLCYPKAYTEPVVTTVTEPDGAYVAWYKWGRGMRIYVGIRSWTNVPNHFKYLVAFHEAYHWYQYLSPKTLDSPGLQRDPAPVWLIEGSAEWAAAEAMVHFGLAATRDQARLYETPRLSRSTLASFEEEREDTGDYDYALFYQAADALIRDHGGKVAMRRYWDFESSLVSWRVYFKDAFGISAKKFYAEFTAG
jgi:hypothetical protein